MESEVNGHSFHHSATATRYRSSVCREETIEGVPPNFPDRLRAVRRYRGMRQSDLLARMDGVGLSMSQHAISHYECGHNNPSVQTLAVMCQVLDCTADYLLGLTEDGVK